MPTVALAVRVASTSDQSATQVQPVVASFTATQSLKFTHSMREILAPTLPHRLAPVARFLQVVCCLLLAASVTASDNGATGPNTEKGNLEKAKILYLDLLAMRRSPDFHKNGFAEGSSFRPWYLRFQALQAEAQRDMTLLSKGIAVADLYTLANEWRIKQGAETEYSRTMTETWNEACGLAPGQAGLPANAANAGIANPPPAAGQPAFKVGDKMTFSTKSGKHFEDATLSQIRADSIVVTHSKGVASVPFEQLPDELVNTFGFDPRKATAARVERANAEALRNAALNEMEQRRKDAAAEEERMIAKRNRAEQNGFRIIQMLPGQGGALAVMLFARGQPKNQTDNEWLGARYDVHASSTVVFIHGNLHPSLVDGDKFQAIAVPEGTFQYVSTLGAEKTVQKWEVLRMSKY